MQAAFQKHVDNAVSKTVNLPKNATIDAVRKVFWLAYRLKCKGTTVYRYGSKAQQVLYVEDGGCAECKI
jgi:ribonucleoside-diphosphate reductase alpha chain